jgi:Fur family ferric uptake transcriptional regulator
MTSWRDELRAAGLRVTRPRLAVLAEVREHPHADVEQIAAGARERAGSLSTQTVYDVLHALAKAGLLRRLKSAGSPARFELETGDNHHHLICRSCGAIVDTQCATDQRSCLQASDDAGYVIEEADVTFWGVCPECQICTSAADRRFAWPPRDPTRRRSEASHH